MRKVRHRRRLSLTSLIDVIFLLLLFFMLTSTFTRFAEVDLALGGAGGAPSSDSPVFLSLAAEDLRVNGETIALAGVQEALAVHRIGDAPLSVLVAMSADVTAQRLTDLLVALREGPALRVTVLEET